MCNVIVKDIPGWAGYKATNQGEIISCPRKWQTKYMILKPMEDINGYLYVGLSKNGKAKSIKVHKLIALTFIGIRPNRLVINHIDRNRKNNKISNLEYITTRENVNHSFIDKKISSQYPGVCFYKKNKQWGAYIQIKKEKHFLGLFKEENNAANAYKQALNTHNNGQSIEPFLVKPKIGGVSFHKQKKQHIARITHNGKRIQLGGFKIRQHAVDTLEKYKQEHNIN